jgi:hypothetical protein
MDTNQFEAWLTHLSTRGISWAYWCFLTLTEKIHLE